MNKEIFFPKYDRMETIIFDEKYKEFIDTLKLRVYETRNYKMVQTTNSQVLARLLYNRENDVILEQTQLIDHINGNTLDNRIENLRIVTKKQNAQNHKVYKSNSVGVSGVKRYSYSANQGDRTDVFLVNWNEDGEQKTSKPFRRLHDAIKFRYEQEKRVYGDYQRLKPLDEILKEIPDVYIEPNHEGKHPTRTCPNCNLIVKSSFNQHVTGCINKLVAAIKESPSDGDILECHICNAQLTRSKFPRHNRTFHKT